MRMHDETAKTPSETGARIREGIGSVVCGGALFRFLDGAGAKKKGISLQQYVD
jgi:hypothetical protein